MKKSTSILAIIAAVPLLIFGVIFLIAAATIVQLRINEDILSYRDSITKE